MLEYEQKRKMISQLQNAIWSTEKAKSYIHETFPSKTDEEIDEMFCGSLDAIIAKLEIALVAVFES